MASSGAVVYGRKSEYVSNEAGWKAAAVSPSVGDAVLEIANRGLEVAQALSAEFAITGEYATAFEVELITTTLRTEHGTHKVLAGVLVNRSGYAMAVELGNSHDHKAHHVLGRTLDALDIGI